MKKTFLYLIAFCILASCAKHHGNISTSFINKKVKYQDIALGVAQTDKYFGIGGLTQDALVLEAKRDLLKNRPLAPNEEYVNFTLDFKNAYYFIYFQTKVTLTADVVTVASDTTTDLYSANYKSKLLGNLNAQQLFAIGDSIIEQSGLQSTISSFVDKDVVRVVYKNDKNRIQTKKVSIYDIYSKYKIYNGTKPGIYYGYSDINLNNLVGTVMAVGLKSVLILDSKKRIKEMKYGK